MGEYRDLLPVIVERERATLPEGCYYCHRCFSPQGETAYVQTVRRITTSRQNAEWKDVAVIVCKDCAIL